MTEIIYSASKTVDRINYPDNSYETFVYDKLGRARETTLTDGSTSIYTLVKRDSQGYPREIVTELDNANTITNTFNYNTDMSLQSVVDDETGHTFSYTYDGVGRISTITRPTGNSQNTAQSFTFDDAGQLTETSLGSYATAKFHYNKDGQTRLAVRWISAGNYVLTVNKYDPVDGQLLRVEHKRSNQEPSYSATTDAINYNSGTLVPLTTLMYAFDDDGRMVSKARILFDSSGAPFRTNQFNFAYDSLGRLIGESYNLGTADGQFSRSYEYNNAGNRTVKYEDGVRTNYSYASLTSQHTNQLSSAAIVGATNTEFLYDSMGNLTAAFVDSNDNNAFDTASENGKAFTWNLAGQLTQVKVWSGGTNTDTAQYTYANNGTGQLLDRTVNGVTTSFHWNGFSPYLEEEDSTEK